MSQSLHNLLIHIGYHKTATTWLQQKLFTTESKVFEPLSKTDRGHSTLARSFIYDDERYLLSPFEQNKTRIQKEIDEIKKAKNNFEGRIPVISHERLSGNPHSSGFDAKKIALMLKESFPESRILIVIREQKSFILSNYFQYLSIGGTDGIEKYLNTRYDGVRPFFSPSHIKYLPLIKEYYDLFGNRNVLVLPYEMFKNEPSLFVGKLGRFLNAELSVEKEKTREILNRKKHYSAMYYMRYLSAFKQRSSVNNYSSFNTKIYEKSSSCLFKGAEALFPKQLDIYIRTKLWLKICNWSRDRYF
ncbi:MAG: sulfotransferase domain-containing protein, partial [Phormidesmis sp.]